MFGFPTATIDRFTPAVEEIYLPSFTSFEGDLEIELDLANKTVAVSSDLPRSFRLKQLFSQQSEAVDSKYIVLDLRINSPQNWAHAITNHLPIALLIKRMLQDVNKPLMLVFPANISAKILQVFRMCGFQCLATYASVEGLICKFKLTPWISIRGERSDIVRQGLQGTELLEALESSEVGAERVFLSRRGKRTISNENEIVSFLEARSFKTLYMEDYSPLEQLAYIAKANEIVSVHGAALGPMIIRSAFSSQPYKLVEIFSPAHVGTAWRMIAIQQGAGWAAVRGKIWPDLLGKKADFVSNMSNFEVSTDSLRLALSSLEID